MENKIFNEYGALHHSSVEARELSKLWQKIELEINNYFNMFPDLTPVEIRCVQAVLSQDVYCTAEVMKRAITIRRSKP